MNGAEREMTCRWCAEGNPRVPSSVSEAMVHTDTPLGRVICSLVSTSNEAAIPSGARWLGWLP